MVEIEISTDEKQEITRNKHKVNSMGTITISTTISQHLWKKAKENNIGWSEAMRRGITSILSEIDKTGEYINPMQQSEKIEKLINKIEELAQENLEYKERLRLRK